MTAPQDGGSGAETVPSKAGQSALASRDEEIRPPTQVVHKFPAPPSERAGTTSNRPSPGEARPRQDSPKIADTRVSGVFDPDDPLPSAQKCLTQVARRHLTWEFEAGSYRLTHRS